MEDLPTSSGTVVVWHADEGWGVIRLDTVGLEAWAHFSAVEAPPGAYRSLDPGARVECRYEMFEQDGYPVRVVYVRPA